MASPVHKRTPAQRKADLPVIAGLLARGMTQAAVAQWLAENRNYSISQQMVAKDAKLIEAEWKQQAVNVTTTFKNRQLVALQELQRDAWLRLEQSTTPRKSSKQGWKDRTPQGGNQGQQGATQGRESFASVENEERLADPRWHMVILKAMEREAALLGLDAPKQLEIETPPSLDEVLPAPHLIAVLEESIEREVRRKHGLNPWDRARRIGPGANGNGSNGNGNGNGNGNH